MRALIAHPHPAVADRLRHLLAQAHCISETVGDGLRVIRYAQRTRYAVIVMHMHLPHLDGVSACRELRLRGCQTPILLVADGCTVEDGVKGLDAGADDCLSMPFEPSEFVARVRALIRRDWTHRSSVVHVGPIELDTVTRQASVAGTSLHLTPREYALLEALATREGRPLTRQYILESVWNDDRSYSNTVDVFVAQLRRKLRPYGADSLIRTVRGVGYMLSADDFLAGEGVDG